MTKKATAKRATAERFWTKVDKSAGPDECWPWMGAANTSGYGLFSFNGSTVTAHRMAFHLSQLHPPPVKTEADPPPGQSNEPETALLKYWIRHTCANKDCMNPSHLFKVKRHKGLLTANERKQLLWFHKQGSPMTELAEHYNISPAEVKRIIDNPQRAGFKTATEVVEARQDALLTQPEAAALAGVAVGTWQAYEYGARAIPKARWLRFMQAVEDR